VSINVIRKELRLGRRFFLIWGGVIIFILALYMPFFPYMQSPDYSKIFEGLPEEFLEAFNIRNIVFQDINYYYATLIMQYLLMLSAIFSATMAGRLISRESDLNTAEFLFTRPLTRINIMASKVAVFMMVNVLLWILLYALAVALGHATDPGEIDLKGQFFVHLSGFVAILAVGGIAFAAAPFINTVQGSTSLGIGLGLGFFLIDAMSKLTEKLSFLKYFNIYFYASFEDAVIGELYLSGLLLLLFVFILGTALGFFFLHRKEFTG
jgi:ABC-2 type transport system permease protein